jgi:hypothetical protein
MCKRFTLQNAPAFYNFRMMNHERIIALPGAGSVGLWEALVWRPMAKQARACGHFVAQLVLSLTSHF